LKTVNLIAIDIAKYYFQLHAVGKDGKVVYKKKLKREELAEFIANAPICRIVMESCGSSQYWARKFKSFGHSVDLIAAQFVKPYVKSQKNDAHDAEAIAEAAMRPNMRFVAIKSVEKQDIQSLHKSRDLIIKTRVALVNHIHGILLEYGIATPAGGKALEGDIEYLLEDASNELTTILRDTISEIWQQIQNLNKTQKLYERQIKEIAKNNDDCQRLMDIPGVGPIVSTHFFSAVADPNIFKNGRQCSAWLGLVPKQNSSGGKTVLGGITKRGDSNLRKILFEGASSVVIGAKRYNRTDPMSLWAVKLWEQKGYKKAVIAVENKMCRIMWHILAKKDVYMHKAS
jgi:transposase